MRVTFVDFFGGEANYNQKIIFFPEELKKANETDTIGNKFL
jgi:hypothetical protein